MILINEKPVPGHEQRISVGFNLADEDMSGNSSSTEKAETGTKGKEITISTNIRFNDGNSLAELTAWAESTDANGERTIFDIAERTCAAMKIKKVRFSGNFNVRPDQQLLQWQVTFNLAEYKSTSEKKQDRSKTAKVAKLAPTGTATGKSNFSQGLNKLNSKLAN